MNKCIMLGRLCRDVEIRTDNDKSVARFSIAVNRRFKNANGEYEADFISCVAFGGTADFIAKYFSKGSMIALTGRWSTGSYTNKDGVKVYTNDLVVEEVDFAGDRSSSNNEVKASAQAEATTEATTSFAPIDDESDLPF